MRSVEELVGELFAVLRGIGLPIPTAAGGPLSLDEIDEVIAPARLPASVRALWELLNPDGLAGSVRIYPQLSTPEFGLEVWRMNHDAEGFNPGQPRHFFQLCYSSHDTMWVECDGPGWVGGALFESFISDPAFPFTLSYESIEDWLEVLIASLREGAFEEVGDGFVRLNDGRQRELAAARLAAHGPDPVLGTQVEVPTDYMDWPAEWRRRSGIELDEPALDDGITTIAQLIRDSRLRPIRATVRARVIRHFSQIVIFDATGQLQLALPKNFSGRVPVGYEHLIELEMPARGEPTPPLRDSSFHMNPLRRHNFDRFKVSADGLVRKIRIAEGKSTEPEWNVAAGGVVFRRLPYLDEYRPNQSTVPEVGSIHDLLAAIPGVLVRCIPPRHVLNDLLRRGRVEPSERPGCEWTPFELSPPAYADLVEELEFEGTRVAPFTWGPYDRSEPSESVMKWDDYLAWRESLPEPGRPTVDEMSANLTRARRGVDAAGEDGEHIVAARLELWEAQRPAVLYLRRRWRGRIHYRGWIELERLGTTLLTPTVDLFTAQRALWFATKAGDADRIRRASVAFIEAQDRLTKFLDIYGPGGTRPPGFEDTIEREPRWKPPFPLLGLSQFPGAPTVIKTRREQWLPKQPAYPSVGTRLDLAPGDLLAVTLYYGEPPRGDYTAVMTSREWTSGSSTPTPDRQAIDALVIAVKSRDPWLRSLPLVPNDPDLVDSVREEVTTTTEHWSIDGQAHPATVHSARDAYAVLITLPGITVIVSGTAPLHRGELTTVTDLSKHGI